MKRIAYCLLPLALCACGEIELPEADVPTNDVPTVEEYTKNFTFTVKGDFVNPQFVEGDDAGEIRVPVIYEPTDAWGDSQRMTRGNQYMTADGVEMTDLWVVDVVGGEIKQSVHQTSSDDDWGAPSMSLTLGTHHVMFLASRGQNPAYEEGVVKWTKPSDTFYLDYEVTVAKTSNGNRAVTLGRVATKMSLVVEDAIAQGTTRVVMVPSKWYNGFDMLSGVPTEAAEYSAQYDLPASWVGTKNNTLNMWGLSGADEWVTDVAVTSYAGSVVNASAVIADAPFVANRSTVYRGKLYSNDANSSVSLNAQWLTAYEGVY